MSQINALACTWKITISNYCFCHAKITLALIAKPLTRCSDHVSPPLDSTMSYLNTRTIHSYFFHIDFNIILPLKRSSI